MTPARATLATCAFLVSLLCGLGLGSYTIGGFKLHQPVDLIAQAAAQTQLAADAEAREAALMPRPPARHVCTGCDAGLYKDAGWSLADDEWAREDEARAEEQAEPQETALLERGEGDFEDEAKLLNPGV